MDNDQFESWRDKETKDNLYGKNLKNDVWRYIWKDASVKTIAPSSMANWHFFEDLGIFAWRTSWDNNSSYFTCRSGQHYQGHGQPDDGQFMLHKAGVPYIIDMGYSNPKTTKEHNVLLVDGKGQIGEGQDWPDFGFYPDNKDNWGNTEYLLSTDNRVKGMDEYFDVVLNPTNLYDSICLKNWTREIIHLNDFYILKDDVSTEREAQLELLLHSYVSEPGKKGTFEYENTRDKNPFTQIDEKNWRIVPSTKENCEALMIQDLSSDRWEGDIEESFFYDNYVRKKDGVGYIQLGNHISRKITGKEKQSIVMFGFENSIKNLNFSSNKDGIEIERNGKKSGEINWDKNNALSGYYTKGDNTQYFFRDISHVSLATLKINSNPKIGGFLNVSSKSTAIQIIANGPGEVEISGLPKKGQLGSLDTGIVAEFNKGILKLNIIKPGEYTLIVE